ncbi:MAG: polysaccharide biosynthesis/export family protein [Planctomycetes bacterium]|nr:polysaccharide biosynthesis/export family protein [Planctomycetota bacterium]
MRHAAERWAVVPAAVTLLCGCAPKNADILHFLREHEHEVSAIEYRVGIPDAVGISAPRILEIDGEVQRIQPDGKINLRLLGEVKIVGMTAKEIAAKLEVLLSRYYVDPKVSVRLVAYASKKYYVYGQAQSGARVYTGRDTLLDAVLASGVDYLSWTSQVKVVRPAHGETPVRTLHVNVDKMIHSGDWSQNVLLEPDDIVYIPATPLAWIGLRLREVLFPVGPVVQAYTAPAEVIYANDVYDREARGYGSPYRARTY